MARTSTPYMVDVSSLNLNELPRAMVWAVSPAQQSPFGLLQRDRNTASTIVIVRHRDRGWKQSLHNISTMVLSWASSLNLTVRGMSDTRSRCSLQILTKTRQVYLGARGPEAKKVSRGSLKLIRRWGGKLRMEHEHTYPRHRVHNGAV